MSNPTLGFVIKAFNQTGGAFREIRGAIAGMGSESKKTESSFQGVVTQASGIAQEVFKANVATKAFSFGLAKVQQGVGFLQGKIQQATDLQLELVSATNNLKSVAGVTYGEAKTEMEQLNNALAQSAASLPGLTQDYKTLGQSISDNVVEAYKDANGNVDLEQWRETTESISSSFGAITASSTKDIGNTMLSLNQAMAGASIQQLSDLSLFQQNANLTNELEAQLKERGVSSLGDLGIKQRMELIRDIGEKFIDEDFKKHAGETVEGLTQGFMSALFDPSSGLFGMMRDLEAGVEGTQSLFSAYNDSLKALIGEDSILTEFTKVVKNLGLSFDPMAALKSILDYVNSRLEIVRTFLESISGMTDRVEVFQEVLTALLGQAIPYVINQVSYFIVGLMDGVSLFVQDVLAAIASPSASDLLGTLKDATSSLLGNIDFPAVATAFTGVLTAAVLAVSVKAVVGTLAASLFGAIKVAIIGPVTAGLLGFGAALTGLMGGLIVPIGIIAAIAAGAVFLLSQDQGKIKDAFDGLRSRLEDFLGFALNIEAISGKISGFLATVSSRLLDSIASLVGSIDFKAVGDNAGNVLQALGSGLSSAMEIFGGVAKKAIMSIDFSAIFSIIKETSPDIVRGIGSALGKAIPTMLNLALTAINVAADILMPAALQVVNFAVRGLFAIPWISIFLAAGEIILKTLSELDWGKFGGALFKVLVIGAAGLGAKAVAGLAVAKFVALYNRVLLVPLQNFMLNKVLPSVAGAIAKAKATLLPAFGRMFTASSQFFTKTALPAMLGMIKNATIAMLGAAKTVAIAMVPFLPVIALFAAGVAAMALVFKLFGGDFQQLSLLFSMSGEEWKAAFTGWMASVGEGILQLWENFSEWLESVGDWFSEGWDNLRTGISETFSAVVEEITPAPLKAAFDLGFDGIAQKVQAALSNINPLKFFGNDDVEPETRGRGGRRRRNQGQRNETIGSDVAAAARATTAATTGYRGFIPTASEGWVRSLIAAGRQEQRNMPSDSDLVVANSSETILRPDQFSALLSGATARQPQPQQPQQPLSRPQQPISRSPNISGLERRPAPGSGSTTGGATGGSTIGTINITVNVPETNASTSPDFVDEMLRQINLRLQQYQAGQLG